MALYVALYVSLYVQGRPRDVVRDSFGSRITHSDSGWARAAKTSWSKAAISVSCQCTPGRDERCSNLIGSGVADKALGLRSGAP